MNRLRQVMRQMIVYLSTLSLGIKNTVLCPIKANNNTIEFTMHTSCLDLLHVMTSQPSILAERQDKKNQDLYY